MTRPLIVLRPEPGLGETLAAARALGLAPIAAPLFAMEPVAWTAPDAAGFDGILAGSANAFRLGGAELAAIRALPVHAVGSKTAEAAQAVGFAVAAVGDSNLQPMLDSIALPARMLRLAGEAHVELAAPAGMTIEKRVLYRARPLALTVECVAALRGGAVAVLHSGEAARAFAAECDRLAIARRGVTIAALARRIAAAAGEGWAGVAVAPAVNDAALLALAATLCQ